MRKKILFVVLGYVGIGLLVTFLMKNTSLLGPPPRSNELGPFSYVLGALMWPIAILKSLAPGRSE